jgi:hypothetical protein
MGIPDSINPITSEYGRAIGHVFPTPAESEADRLNVITDNHLLPWAIFALPDPGCQIFAILKDIEKFSFLWFRGYLETNISLIRSICQRFQTAFDTLPVESRT